MLCEKTIGPTWCMAMKYTTPFDFPSCFTLFSFVFFFFVSWGVGYLSNGRIKMTHEYIYIKPLHTPV